MALQQIDPVSENDGMAWSALDWPLSSSRPDVSVGCADIVYDVAFVIVHPALPKPTAGSFHESRLNVRSEDS